MLMKIKHVIEDIGDMGRMVRSGVRSPKLGEKPNLRANAVTRDEKEAKFKCAISEPTVPNRNRSRLGDDLMIRPQLFDSGHDNPTTERIESMASNHDQPTPH